MLTTSITLHRKPKDGKDAVSYEILLDTDSVVLKSDTKQFETHKLGDVHFMYHQGSYMEDMTMRIIDTYSYIILYYGYEAKKDENGKPVLGSDGKPVMEYKAITYSSNEGETDIWNTMQMNVGDDAECYGMKYIWYDKNLPDNDEAMFEKIWSELDGIPPKELDIKILATKMFTVRREADSVQSSDVVFAVGDNKTTAPTTGWITNFSGLTLADGKYVWTCTKTTLTNGTSYYTGAYCLGECYDFAHVDELYALGSSATKSPDIDSSLGVNIWQSSYTPKKGMYLWTCVRVTYNSNNIPYYLNKKCVSYFPTDGTNGNSFTPKGTADGYYSKATEIPAYSDEQNGKIYIVDDATNVTSPFIVPDAPYVAQYVLHNGEYVLYLVHAEFGDGYNVNGHLYVANDDKWVYLGEIQGEKGEQGEPGIDGKDAINIVFSPAELVFDADENGNLKQAEKSAEIKVYRGTTELQYKTDWDNDAEIGDNCWAALLVNTTTNKPEVKISGITSSNIDDVKVPATSGGANVSVIVDGVKYRAYLPFSVNVNTYANFLIRDNKKYISKYTEVSNKYNTISNELNGKASKDELMEVSSSIEQTARRISLEVSSNAVGRRNLLVNSDFHNQESLYFSSGTRIECTTGKDGINCVHITSSSENGVYWDGTKSGGMSVVITKGKKYTFSCWVKSSSTSAQFRIRTYSTSDIANASSKTDFYETYWMNVSSPNTWELFTFTIDTSSAVTNYLAVIFCVTSASDAYICQPMMEEGDTYKGWSRSQQDYDYVVGNMIDNARTLEVGGSLKSLNPNGLPDYERAYYGDCMSIRFKNTNANNTYSVMEFATDSMELDVDYIFSFLAKGKANIGLYAQCDINAVGDSVFSEDSVNQGTRLLNVRYASIIEIPNQLTTQYKRYWGHMRFHGHLPSKLYIQLNGAGEVYVCQPKLEKGATMTEFTERKTDLVDKASLKKAGIEITSEQVTLYGNKVQVKTPKANPSEGYDEAAMFQNGKLNAQFINAGDIVAEGINAQKITATKLNVTGDSKIGIWHIKKVDGWGDIMQAEGTEYNGTTVVSGIQYCPLFVRGGSLLTDYFRVGVSCTEFSYTSGNNDFSAVWLGNAARIVCKGSSNAMNLPTNYAYNTQYEPVHYIYSEQSKKDSPALAINVIAKGFTGTPTALQTNGAIRGVIAPNLRIMNYSGQISSSDCIVIVTEGGITLKLPAGPIVGQTLLIYSKVSSNVYIEYDSSGGYGTGKMYSGGSLQTKIEIGRAGTFTYFIFDGENWCYAYFNGSHHSV